LCLHCLRHTPYAKTGAMRQETDPLLIEHDPGAMETILIAEQTDYASMLEWLHRCDQSHEMCYKTGSGSLPKRLIDVSELLPCLVDASKIQSSQVRYVTLSYCWGSQNEPFATTKSSLRSRERGMWLRSMPKTFRQPIEVCRALNVPYL
jgi:hypothetical protein